VWRDSNQVLIKIDTEQFCVPPAPDDCQDKCSCAVIHLIWPGTRTERNLHFKNRLCNDSVEHRCRDLAISAPSCVRTRFQSNSITLAEVFRDFPAPPISMCWDTWESTDLDCLKSSSSVYILRPEDGGSKCIWNAFFCLADCTAQHPSRQSSSGLSSCSQHFHS
jgi:hypothetical protein